MVGVGVVHASIRCQEFGVWGTLCPFVGARETGAECCVGEGTVGVECYCDYEFAGGDGIDDFLLFRGG